MKVTVFVPVILLIALGSGCGAKNVYDSLRFYQETECQKLQGADRDECYKRAEMSYDEYQRQLKEREQKR
jgi:3-hydroxy-3-methylglutaryl CoA synthase